MGFHFEERQSFTQWWLWLIVVTITIGVNTPFTYAVVQQLILRQPIGNTPISDEALLVISVILLTISTGLSLLFLNSVLEVRIDSRALEYRFVPLIREWKRIEANAILDVNTRRYYLVGYGIKRDFHGTRTMTVKGSHGIELTLEGRSRLLIGTQR